MNNDKIYVFRIISIILLALSSIPFFINFFFESSWNIETFIFCLIPMAFFAIIFFRFDHQMRNRKNCSKYEYLKFYNTCKSQVKVSGFNLSNEDKAAIKLQAKDLEYFSNIEEDVLIEIYKKRLKEYKAKAKKQKAKNKK